jgi:hypothetical protein
VTIDERIEYHQKAAADLRAALLRLAGKINQSVSFGDQSLTLIEEKKKREALMYHEAEEQKLTRLMNGQSPYPKWKVHF